MQIYVKGRGRVDEISRPEIVEEFVPDGTASMMDMKRMRNFYAEVKAQGGKMGGSGDIRWVARVPRAIWALWTEDDPDIEWNKKKFFAKLDQHPHFATYERKTRKSGG